MARNQFELNPDFVINAGRIIAGLGTGLLIAEAIAGLFAIDIAILVSMIREEKRSSSQPSFLTWYLWMNMSRNNYSLMGQGLLGIGLGSFVQSLTAGLLLSLEFGMPIIFFAILQTWVGTIGMVAAGKALESYGQQLKLKRMDSSKEDTSLAAVVYPPDLSKANLPNNLFSSLTYFAPQPEPSAPPQPEPSAPPQPEPSAPPFYERL